MRGNERSSANLVEPVTLARPSTRRKGLPTMMKSRCGSGSGFLTGLAISLFRVIDVDEVLIDALDVAVDLAAALERIEVAHATLHLDGERHGGHAGDEDPELAVDRAPVE